MATEIRTLVPPLTERKGCCASRARNQAEIRARGVTRLCMFGSIARGETILRHPYPMVDAGVEPVRLDLEGVLTIVDS